MQITKCDYCKKTIEEGDAYALEMCNAKRFFEFGTVNFDICEDCYRKLCKKLTDKEENEDGNTES